MNDHAHQGGERFTVEVEAMPDDVPPVVRLKLWLKAALRSHRLRCRSVIDSTPPLPESSDRPQGETT